EKIGCCEDPGCGEASPYVRWCGRPRSGRTDAPSAGRMLQRARERPRRVPGACSLLLTKGPGPGVVGCARDRATEDYLTRTEPGRNWFVHNLRMPLIEPA